MCGYAQVLIIGFNNSHTWIKLSMCVQIARRLLGKILIDLRNTREEATSVSDAKDDESPTTTAAAAKSKKDDIDYLARLPYKNEDGRRTSSTSEKSLEQDEDEDKETKYRLDPKSARLSFPILNAFYKILFLN